MTFYLPSPEFDKKSKRRKQTPPFENDNKIANVVLMPSEAPKGGAASRVSKWTTSFETLLADAAGLHSFAEFLKQEYSHENIYFWTACERYKQAESADMRKCLAKEIYNRHMADDALMPVNVDASAHRLVSSSLDSPDEKLFTEPQEQVFKLMKYDSYARFIRSSLFKVCEIRDQRQQPLPYPGDHLTMDLNLRTDKALMSPESHRRRSTSFTEGRLKLPDKALLANTKHMNRSSVTEHAGGGHNAFTKSPEGSRKVRLPKNEDEMCEYLKIADKQLDDQRGTAINFEMPDFLKNTSTKTTTVDTTPTKI